MFLGFKEVFWVSKQVEVGDESRVDVSIGRRRKVSILGMGQFQDHIHLCVDLGSPGVTCDWDPSGIF